MGLLYPWKSWAQAPATLQHVWHVYHTNEPEPLLFAENYDGDYLVAPQDGRNITVPLEFIRAAQEYLDKHDGKPWEEASAAPANTSTVYTLSPAPSDAVDAREPAELLAAAEAAGWPDVYLQPEHRTVEWREPGQNVRVAGEQGWQVFAQLHTQNQLLAARRLLLRLLSEQGAEVLVATAAGLIGPKPGEYDYAPVTRARAWAEERRAMKEASNAVRHNEPPAVVSHGHQDAAGTPYAHGHADGAQPHGHGAADIPGALDVVKDA